MKKESKSIRKTDDSALSLLYDTLGDDANKVTDIDSYYRIKNRYIFLEFIKVSNTIENYSPNDNWLDLKKEILNIWEFTQKAEGSLWLICYPENRSTFKLFKVANASDEEVSFQKEHDYNINELKQWFQLLNAQVLKG